MMRWVTSVTAAAAMMVAGGVSVAQRPPLHPSPPASRGIQNAHALAPPPPGLADTPAGPPRGIEQARAAPPPPPGLGTAVAFKPPTAIDRGDHYSSVGKYDLAILWYRRALLKDATSAWLWARLVDARGQHAVALLGDADKPDASALPPGRIRLAIREATQAMHDLAQGDALARGDRYAGGKLDWYIGGYADMNFAFELAKKLHDTTRLTPDQQHQRDRFMRTVITETFTRRWPRIMGLVHDPEALGETGNWLSHPLLVLDQAMPPDVQPQWQAAWYEALSQWADRAKDMTPLPAKANRAAYFLNAFFKTLSKHAASPWNKPNPLAPLAIHAPDQGPVTDPADKLMAKGTQIPWTVSRLLVDLPPDGDHGPWRSIQDPLIVDGHLVFLRYTRWDDGRRPRVERIDVPLDHDTDQPLKAQSSLTLAKSVKEFKPGRAVYCRGQYLVPTDQGLLIFPRRGKGAAVQLTDKLPGERVTSLAVMNHRVYAAVGSAKKHVSYLISIDPVTGAVRQLASDSQPRGDNAIPIGFGSMFADPARHRLIFVLQVYIGWANKQMRYHTYRPATGQWQSFEIHDNIAPLSDAQRQHKRDLLPGAPVQRGNRLVFRGFQSMYTWNLDTDHVDPVWIAPSPAIRLRPKLLHAGRLWFGWAHFGEMPYAGPNDDQHKIHPVPQLFGTDRPRPPRFWLPVDDHTLVLADRHRAWRLRIKKPKLAHATATAPPAKPAAVTSPTPPKDDTPPPAGQNILENIVDWRIKTGPQRNTPPWGVITSPANVTPSHTPPPAKAKPSAKQAGAR